MQPQNQSEQIQISESEYCCVQRIAAHCCRTRAFQGRAQFSNTRKSIGAKTNIYPHLRVDCSQWFHQAWEQQKWMLYWYPFENVPCPCEHKWQAVAWFLPWELLGHIHHNNWFCIYIITIEPQDLRLTIGNNTCLETLNHTGGCIYFEIEDPSRIEYLNRGRRTIHIIMSMQLTMSGQNNSLSAFHYGAHGCFWAWRLVLGINTDSSAEGNLGLRTTLRYTAGLAWIIQARRGPSWSWASTE